MKHKKTLQNFKVLFPLLFIVSLWSCERDDICAAATPTTPRLYVQFYDINNRTETKFVRHMSVIAEGNPNYIINDKTRDTVLLPIRLDALNVVNTNRFVFTKDVDSISFSNTDILVVNFIPELIYVSRACGYKSVFNELSASRETDTNNWIIDVEVINTTINNEDAAQINIYH